MKADFCKKIRYKNIDCLAHFYQLVFYRSENASETIWPVIHRGSNNFSFIRIVTPFVYRLNQAGFE